MNIRRDIPFCVFHTWWFAICCAALVGFAATSDTLGRLISGAAPENAA